MQIQPRDRLFRCQYGTQLQLCVPQVTMSGVGYHNGRAYYSVMTWYTPGYRMYWNSRWSNTAVLHFRYYAPGTTSPGWF